MDFIWHKDVHAVFRFAILALRTIVLCFVCLYYVYMKQNFCLINPDVVGLVKSSSSSHSLAPALQNSSIKEAKSFIPVTHIHIGQDIQISTFI